MTSTDNSESAASVNLSNAPIAAGQREAVGIAQPGYLHWAKTHKRARYELTTSGVPPVSWGDIAEDLDMDLTVYGDYGDPALIAAIAGWRGVTPDRVLPCLGTSTANFVALAAAGLHGGRILVEDPGYDPLVRAVQLLRLPLARFPRRAADGYRPDTDVMARLLDRGVAAVVLTDLHNPSGGLCPESDLREIAALTEARGAWLIVDEVYLDYAVVNRARKRRSALELGDHVVVTDSLTKVYGLGALRAGWVLASPRFLEMARHVIDLLNAVNPVVSARLTRLVIGRLDDLARRCRSMYETNWPIMRDWLQRRRDLGRYADEGAMFTWLRLPPGVRSEELCTRLRQRYDTNVVCGSFFAASDHIRIGWAVPADDLREGLARIGRALDELTVAS